MLDKDYLSESLRKIAKVTVSLHLCSFLFSFSIPSSALFSVFNYAVDGFQEMKYMVYVRGISQNSIWLFLSRDTLDCISSGQPEVG